MDERHEIRGAGLSAVVKADGAELVSLRDAGGAELLWQAGPEWPRHAPLLFPIVGRLAGDALRHEGRSYRMTQHGFARDSRFDWVERTPSRAVLRLADSETTRALFPFAFVLEQSYEIAGGRLTVGTRVENPGDAPLTAGVGAHPAVRWPLADGVPKERHRVVFEARETGVARRVKGGLLGPAVPLPFDGRALGLSEALFAEDALVMPDVASRGVAFEALDGEGRVARSLAVAWEGYKDLGLWSKPGGAPFLCIEPWYGMASPMGWDGAFRDKPGLLTLGPGEAARFSWSVAVEG